MITEVPGPVLQYYDPSVPVKVQVDASQTGLGAVVMQNGQSIAYASKSLTSTQQAYTQIEKEALALVFGCEKFHHYLYGRDFVAETDHKPLEIIMKKPLHLVPMRLQRMRIRPWQVVATDLFVWNNTNYVLVVDYYSNYFEVVQLSNTKSPTVIRHIKSLFARHGIPEVVISDNGPQYTAEEFTQFTKSWGFKHQTSSPMYPQSNGLAERTVQTVKNLLKKAKASNQDPYLSLLSYRNTSSQQTGSPAQLLMNRRLRTDLPTSPKQLLPKLNDRHLTRKMLEQRKLEQKKYYDRTAKSLPSLHPNDFVRVFQRGKWEPAVIVDVEETPRSYKVRTTDGGMYRRNRRHLQVPKAEDNQQSASTNTPEEKMEISEQSPVKSSQEKNPEVPSEPDYVATRSGRVVRKPKRYGEYA